MQKTRVGTSSRTPFKHWILNSELGRICGTISTGNVHAKACPFHVIDLCAGDGCQSVESRNTSPAIIEKHCRWMLRKNLDVKATLIERLPKTFSLLCQNTPNLLWMERLNMDAREYQLRATNKHQAVFIHADPNHIGDWPLTRQLLDSMPETTTMLATLGCNVGGLKRLTRDEREVWFGHVKECLDAMPKYHDAILVELVNDSSQWAYLLRLPRKWSEETAYTLVNVGQKFISFDLNLASVSHQPVAFRALENKLFLTKEERGEK